MILVYTGNGKGKTSACVGQAVRAHGQGLRVVFGQFMKRLGQAGEQVILADLLQERFKAGGMGFFRNEKDRPEHQKAASALLSWAKGYSGRADMIVLDEALYALGHGLVSREEMEELILLSGEKDWHLVLSGRGLPGWLARYADLVTEMTAVKHPLDKGIVARKGIEF